MIMRHLQDVPAVTHQASWQAGNNQERWTDELLESIPGTRGDDEDERLSLVRNYRC
jgi:hypothetical protein